MTAESIETTVLRVHPQRPQQELIDQAVEVLRAGGIVAFPTETVYGLGARGLVPAAVAKIFEAKGRPPTNPLILHVRSIEEARDLAASWPDAAERLARAFWPGPMTLVVRRADHIPEQVCAGLDTVAIRVPSHPVAQALLEALGEPVAAPSANRYTELSPTTAAHVVRGLAGRIDLILDGGPTEVGLESTLISLIAQPPQVLRPGQIDMAALQEILGEVVYLDPADAVVDESTARPSPGLSARHYAPQTPIEVVSLPRLRALLAERDGPSRAFVIFDDGEYPSPGQDVTIVRLPRNVHHYGARLYATLHALDQAAVDEIVIEEPPNAVAWAAVHDRLTRAASS